MTSKLVLPQAFLDELASRISLVVLIGRRVKLTQSSRDWKGCCPFHSEKSPSFYVYKDHYHCFGCGAHGEAISFLMKTNGLDYRQAVEALAKEAKLPLPVTGKASQSLPVARPSSGNIQTSEPIIRNQSTFNDLQLEAILATAARLLVREQHIAAASILANARGNILLWQHDNWSGGQDTWRLSLSVPAEVYLELEDRALLESQMDKALGTALESVTDADFITTHIVTALDPDPAWRDKVNLHVSGAGVTNQGRIRSDNIATLQHDGLLFRSRPEIFFYEALKNAGAPFAPLSVVLHGGRNYRRVEPDFIIYKDGLAMIVEIDGDLYHSESPSEGHSRLKFLTDEGLRLERIAATQCDTPDKARAAVERVLRTIGKLRGSR